MDGWDDTWKESTLATSMSLYSSGRRDPDLCMYATKYALCPSYGVITCEGEGRVK